MTDEQLGAILQEGLGDPSIPAEIVYWRAQLQQRREREAVAIRPIMIAQSIAIPVLICGSVLILPDWRWGLALIFSACVAGLAIRFAYHSE